MGQWFPALDNFIGGTADNIKGAGETVWNAVDFVAFDLLPGSNTSSLEGNISDGVGSTLQGVSDFFGGLFSGATTELGQTPVNILNPTIQQLPQWGGNIGMGFGNLAQYGISGLGVGVGSAVGSVGQGVGTGVGGIGDGLTKPLIVAGVVVVGLVLVLAFATKGRDVNAGQVRIAGGRA